MRAITAAYAGFIFYPMFERTNKFITEGI